MQIGMGPVCAKKKAAQDSAENNKALFGPSPEECGAIIMRRVDGNAHVNIPFNSEIATHSPTGFEWGYSGSGPAELAKQILLHVFGTPDGYQEFKFNIIAGIPREGGQIDIREIKDWKTKYLFAETQKSI